MISQYISDIGCIIITRMNLTSCYICMAGVVCACAGDHIIDNYAVLLAPRRRVVDGFTHARIRRGRLQFKNCKGRGDFSD